MTPLAPCPSPIAARPPPLPGAGRLPPADRRPAARCSPKQRATATPAPTKINGRYDERPLSIGTDREAWGVDIVVYDGDRLLPAGEAKWSAGQVDLDALGQLEATARHLPGFGPETRLLLVGRDGFTARLRQIEEEGRAVLWTGDDLYR